MRGYVIKGVKFRCREGRWAWFCRQWFSSRRNGRWLSADFHQGRHSRQVVKVELRQKRHTKSQSCTPTSLSCRALAQVLPSCRLRAFRCSSLIWYWCHRMLQPCDARRRCVVGIRRQSEEEANILTINISKTVHSDSFSYQPKFWKGKTNLQNNPHLPYKIYTFNSISTT